jgi:outer membrane immunogenic protein
MARLRVIGATVLLYLGTQLAVAMADPAASVPSGSGELARLNAEILLHPADTALNLRYATLAEQLGKPRLALTAYERILVYDPQNQAALAGVSRIRTRLQPNTTTYVLGLSWLYESNPLYYPQNYVPGLAKREGEFSGYLNVKDERQIGSYSWRTLGRVDGIVHGTQPELDYAHAGVMTGPVLDLLPGLQVNPAVGGAVAAWDSHFFYGEAAASATFEAYPSGAYESVLLRAALRRYDTFFAPQHDGGYVEAIGRFTVPMTVPNTAFVISPWVRWAEIKGPIGSVPTNPLLIQPGDYTDVGARIEGYYSPREWIVLGANFAASERFYRNELVTGSTVTERRDTTLFPGASILFPHLGDYQNDLRFDYKYITNRSNDPNFTFVDNVVTITWLRRFGGADMAGKAPPPAAPVTNWTGDMPVKAPPLAAPVASVFNWTGFYVGGNFGAVGEQASGTSDFLDTVSGFEFFTPTNPLNNSFSDMRFLGGVQIGYNWQFAPMWVVGVEGDWDWTDTRYFFCRQTVVGGAPCQELGAGFNVGFEKISSRTDWLATVRGRLGVPFGDWLFYGTGGAAWGRINTTLTLSCLGVPPDQGGGCGSSALPLFASSTFSTTKAGWVAGLGAEMMLAGHWAARAEWLHIDLGTITDSLPTVGDNGTQTAVWSRAERFEEFRGGLSYLF